MIKKRHWKVSYRKLRKSPFFIPLLLFIPFFFIIGISIYVIEYRFNQQFSSIIDGLWWTIVTFSTTGYGDQVPQTLPGRVIAIIAIIFGMTLSTILAAALASIFVRRVSLERSGFMEIKRIRNHLIICGWKKQIEDIIIDILKTSKDFIDEDIVLISNVSNDEFEKLHENVLLRGVKFIRGDYFSEQSLVRANVRRAKKVIVLADTAESSAASEADSKTVLTVLTIKGISKDLYICAELLDQKYLNYLREVNCNEIIMIRDLARKILVATSKFDGLTHVVQSLINLNSVDSEETAELITENIPKEAIGESYAQFRDDFTAQNKDQVLLGILENTGSIQRIKLAKVKDAQKTVNVERMVQDLQKVRSLEVNKPMFLPEDGYILSQFSQLIILRSVQKQSA